MDRIATGSQHLCIELSDQNTEEQLHISKSTTVKKKLVRPTKGDRSVLEDMSLMTITV